jgi:hypothetical protein
MFIFWLCALFTRAQNNVGMGAVLLGGTAGFTFSSNDVPVGTGPSAPVTQAGQRTISFSPRVGYFVSDKVAVGVQFGYDWREGRQVSISGNGSFTQVTTTNAFAFGPFVRYTHLFTERFGLIGQFSFSYQTGNSQISLTNFINFPSFSANVPRQNLSGIGAAIQPGIVYFIGRRLGLEATIGALQYTNITTTQDGLPNLTNQSFALNFGLNTLQFGAQVYLGRGDK